MKKVALVFVLAVFVPSLVLAWLAVRSLRDQQFILERQQSLLYQGVADAKAKQVQDVLTGCQHGFAGQVARLIGKRDPKTIASGFDDLLGKDWPMAQVGFAVSLDGEIKAPSLYGRIEARRFLDDNGRFLANRETVDVYANPKQALNFVNATMSLNAVPQPSAPTQADSLSQLRPPGGQNPFGLRNVVPQQQLVDQPRFVQSAQAAQQFSKVLVAPAEFRQIIGEDTEGTLARFVDNRLSVLVWYRPPGDTNLVFGAQLALVRLVEELSAGVRQIEPSLHEGICVALLDDTARPVALSHPGFRANWKRPFVATEIGEALPHWEVAVYLLNPAKLSQSARLLRLMLGLLIGVLLLAIGVGSWLIVSDLNRQLTLARQKTDFVSNVSHELKTPLTSIRMFAELLAEGRVSDRAKQRSYLGIITAETARLTRLINNVLDFARIERGEKKYQFQECDLVDIMRETAETYRPHLEANGFLFECELPGAAVRLNADRDALAQVVVNLLSNAEKYSNSRKEITLSLNLVGTRSTASVTSPEKNGTRWNASLPGAGGPGARVAQSATSCVEVKVMDRGLGVPAGCEEKVFEQFYRAHDSLSNGIQGSGLGLTLARQIARVHGGDVTYAPREGGGSCFTLRLPVIDSVGLP
ncbi:MAG TPA: HAMP domain-containing sensor histidine kinase [Verrucomicrobiota bacterium]|nr:HAMP domain-containing sensor histidine kinase [Verrucomicrobiota bacterium]HQL78227.1 HAMP domain-containing sensor histidine kinase [Verrucomicrobiota bacterium]